MIGKAARAGARLRERVIGPRLANVALRLGLTQLLPERLRGRLLAAGVDHFDLERVLARMRRAEDWANAWADLAKEKEAQARAAEDDGRCVTAVELWLAASNAYYFAQFVDYANPRRKHDLYARCAAAYAWAAHRLDPPAERVEIPFATVMMPGYLRRPPGTVLAPLVVSLNGTNSAKEEFRLWEDKLLARGLATLSFDGPGFGETWEQMALIPEYERVGAAVADYLQTRGDVDSARLGIFGPSLGGLLGVRTAAHDRRYRALVALCAPYDVAPYWDQMDPLVRQGVGHLLKTSGEPLRRAVAAASIRGLVARVRCPLLVVGAGRDAVVPSEESRRIHAEATTDKDLWFYPEADHICLGAPNLLANIADWLAGELGTQSKVSCRPAARA